MNKVAYGDSLSNLGRRGNRGLRRRVLRRPPAALLFPAPVRDGAAQLSGDQAPREDRRLAHDDAAQCSR